MPVRRIRKAADGRRHEDGGPPGDRGSKVHQDNCKLQIANCKTISELNLQYAICNLQFRIQGFRFSAKALK
jgi:hypothetical protein